MKEILITFCLALSFAGCAARPAISPAEDRKLIDAEIVRLHGLYNEQRFDEIAERLVDPQVLEAKGGRDLIEGLERQHRNYGKMLHAQFSSQRATEVNAQTGNREIKIIYKTQFEKTVRFEVFVFYVDKGARLAAYRVNTSLGHAELDY